MNSGLKRVIWILNTLGLVLYVVWLYSMQNQDILRSQDGVLYFLPCIPFFFVYMLLIDPKPRPKDAPPEDDGRGTEKPPAEPPPPKPEPPSSR